MGKVGGTGRDRLIIEEAIKRGIGGRLRGEEWERCRGDAGYFIDRWCETYDPRAAEGERVVPFRLYKRQWEYIRWVGELEREALEGPPVRGVCEKSRGVGVTWIDAMIALHHWLFSEGYKCGFGSRVVPLVDAIGNIDSILEKVRWQLERFRVNAEKRWLLPRGWQPKHAGYLKIINPENGNQIIGEGGDQIGRGGRNSQYFVDEAAHLEHPELVEGSLADNTHCRIDVSTPSGPSGPFYERRFGGVAKVFTFHWRDDPRRTEAWSRAKRLEIGEVRYAIEFEIDYTATVGDICIPAEWVRQARGVELRWADGSEYRAVGPITGGFDIGSRGNTLCLRQGPVVLGIEQWPGELEEALWEAVRRAEEAGAAVLYFDSAGPGSKGADVLRRGRGTGVRVIGINGGSGASEALEADGRRAKEVYQNLRAEAWYGRLRERLRKTAEAVRGGIMEHPEELLRLPEDAQLCMELSIPKVINLTSGKIALERKDAMRLRGVSSPHRADALALTLVPEPKLLIPAGAEITEGWPRYVGAY